MEKKNVFEYVKVSSVRLNNLNIQKGSNKVAKRVQIRREHNLEISGVTEDGFNIVLNLKVFCEPDGLFKMDMELVGRYRYINIDSVNSFTTEDIKHNLSRLSEPLFSQASLIIAFLIEKFLGWPVILPPFAFEEENE
ncbi:hypothetical protein [Desulfurispora thermophila]|uniref:hypothetical protein n=1 Tax=Desulfurispora thermophila TaxID=265470 RepID=UPI00036EBE8E|nr:hypothetical protein [Desulfurispora thermophila]